jgi:HlyD family secretion protein
MATEGRRSRSLLRSRGVQTLIVVVVAAIVAIVFFANRGNAPTYFTSPASTRNIISMVQATGTVNPIHTVSIGAQVSGKITSINIHFNSHVKKGELLATIDPSVYQLALESAQSDVANSRAALNSANAQVAVARANVLNGEANVEKAKAALVAAKLQADRSVGLYKQGIVSAQQRDTDVATYQTDLASLNSAKAGLEQNKASLQAALASVTQAKATVQRSQVALKTAQTNLSYCNIYAPDDGVIINRAVDVGQTVASSFSAPLLFSEATDLKTMWVYIETDESDIGRLKVGDDATFTVDAFPNAVFSGKILQRRMFATTVQNVVEYQTILQFQNPNEELFPGMTAYVNIPVAHAYHTLAVPNSALRFKPSLPPAQLRALLAKYNMAPSGEAGGARGGSRAGGSGSFAGGARRQGGGGARGGFAGRGRGNAGGGGQAGYDNPTTSIIYTLDANNNLVPVRVRTGITDFTYTAITKVLAGSLKPGDKVVTGELVKLNSSGLPGGRRGR